MRAIAVNLGQPVRPTKEALGKGGRSEAALGGIMSDVVALLAAGGLLMVYAVGAPSLIDAVPSSGSQKPFTQRLLQAAGPAPVSAVNAGWR